jgi:hypothetical protein
MKMGRQTIKVDREIKYDLKNIKYEKLFFAT